MKFTKLLYDGTKYYVEDNKYVYKFVDKSWHLVWDKDEAEEIIAELKRQQKKVKK